MSSLGTAARGPTDSQPERKTRKSGFRINPASYYRSNTHSRPQQAGPPKSPVYPIVPAFLTQEIPADPKSGASRARAGRKNENYPYDLGGHLTQTLEIPIVQNDSIREADTPYGVFVEIEQQEPAAAMPLPYVHREDPEPEPEVRQQKAVYREPGWTGEIAVHSSDNIRVVTAEFAIPEAEREEDRPEGRSKAGSILRRIFPARFIAGVILCVFLFTPVLLFSGVLRVVILTVDGVEVDRFVSDEKDARGMLLDCGYDLRPADIYRLENVGSSSYLSVTRSARVTVTADGQSVDDYVIDKNVSEVLDELDIALGEDDEVVPALETPVREGDEIIVYRVRYETERVLERVEWKEVDKPSPLVKDGTRRTMNAGGGRDGEAWHTYRTKYVDGQPAGSELVEEVFTVYPVNVITLVGQNDAPMSHFTTDDFLGIEVVDNRPQEYDWLMEGGRCTAYSFTPGTFGASGMYLFQGFVAVNNNVIPYGSLLYITSADGRLIYGWGVAADVGEAMMDGRVDIDCFFETYQESVLFGVHYLNVYIVRQLTRSELQRFAANSSMFNSRIPA